jgi:quinoprotein glucose dehydrogenase
LGDDIATDWRARNKRGMARVRGYYDVHPAENSELTVDPTHRNQYGDPMPNIVHLSDEATESALPQTKQHLNDVFARLARAEDGKILTVRERNYLDHPAGGCRLGTDPAASVVDSFGRTHDHETLFVVGAPTLPNAAAQTAR